MCESSFFALYAPAAPTHPMAVAMAGELSPASDTLAGGSCVRTHPSPSTAQAAETMSTPDSSGGKGRPQRASTTASSQSLHISCSFQASKWRNANRFQASLDAQVEGRSMFTVTGTGSGKPITPFLPCPHLGLQEPRQNPRHLPHRHPNGKRGEPRLSSAAR